MPRFLPRQSVRLRQPRALVPPLRVADILRWADRFHARMGRWPTSSDGPIADTNETWMGVAGALKNGCRGLPGGSTLARLLAEHRGYRNIGDLPRLKVSQILEWADAFQVQTGRWPTMRSGPVAGASNETWHRLDSALRRGARGLRGHTSLPLLLAKYRGVQNLTNRPRWTEALILRWAKRHRRRTGRWPNEACGAVADAPAETWLRIDRSLRAGVRGLPGGSSLAQLLAQHCGVRNLRGLPSYSIKQILRWVDAHHRRTGQWPQAHMGAIPEAPGKLGTPCMPRCIMAGVACPAVRPCRGCSRSTAGCPIPRIRCDSHWPRFARGQQRIWSGPGSGRRPRRSQSPKHRKKLGGG